MEPAPFAAEIRAHGDVLLELARKLCRNQHDACDLVQDVFERALKKHATLRPDSNVRAWLITILHNLHIDRCRQRLRAPQAVAVEPEDLPAPVAEPSRAWHALGTAEVRAALGALPAEQRRVYELHLDGRSYRDIAAALG